MICFGYLVQISFNFGNPILKMLLLNKFFHFFKCYVHVFDLDTTFFGILDIFFQDISSHLWLQKLMKNFFLVQNKNITNDVKLYFYHLFLLEFC